MRNSNDLTFTTLQDTNHNKLQSNNQSPPKTRKLKNIIIDLKNTQYKILKQVSQKMLYWKTVSRKDNNNNNDQPNVIWTDSYISQQELRNLLPYQRINHFPSSFQLGNKHFLSKNIAKMKKKFEQDYNFFPQTWLMPDDFQRFKVHQQKAKSTWIFKPSSSSQGKGIVITKNVDVIEQRFKSPRKGQQQFVLQKYITNPLLIEGLKFDLRIYVLVKSLSPLKIFIFNQARFATKSYQKPQKSNFRNSFMHLTNYAINKKNPDFVFSQQKQHEGHKRTFTSVLKFLQMKGYKTDKLLLDIYALIVKTICSVQPLLSHLYKTSSPNRQDTFQNCFQILGFDILIDENLKPYLLQVNHTPSFRTDSHLDYQVKSNLLKDTLILLNVNSKQKSKFQQSKSKTIIKLEQKIRLNKTASKAQKHNYNGYIKLYPSSLFQQDIYKKYIDYSQLVFDIWTGIIKKKFNQIGTLTPDTKVFTTKRSNFLKPPIQKPDSKVMQKKQYVINNYVPNSLAINKQELEEIRQSLVRESLNFEFKKQTAYNILNLYKNQQAIFNTSTNSQLSQINFSKQLNSSLGTDSKDIYRKTQEQGSFHNFLQKKKILAARKQQKQQNSKQSSPTMKKDISYFLNQQFKRKSKPNKIFTKRQYLSKSKFNHSANYKKLKLIEFPL